MENLRFEISNDGKLEAEEQDFLINIYRDLFTKIYNTNVFDYFYKRLKVFLSAADYFDIAAENYERAVSAIKSAQQDNIDLLLIYYEEKLIGGARMRMINETEASIPEIALANISEDIKESIWKEVIKFSENYFTDLGFDKMYLEIPLEDEQLLIKALDLGYMEDPEDIVTTSAIKTFLLNKKLERNKEFESDFSR